MTKEMSATTRMVLDSVRTLVIWGVSLGVGWQKFQYLQLIGFIILVSGMCVYNDLLIGMYNKYRIREDENIGGKAMNEESKLTS